MKGETGREEEEGTGRWSRVCPAVRATVLDPVWVEDTELLHFRPV